MRDLWVALIVIGIILLIYSLLQVLPLR